MATKLLQVLQWARPFVSNLLMLLDGTTEPALTNANMILGIMLGPPFVWEWNRNTVDFTFTTGDTDATASVPDYGFIETAYLTVPHTAPVDADAIYQLQVRRQVEKSSQPGRPQFIGIFKDIEGGDTTVRLGDCAPDLDYKVTMTFQKIPTFLTSVDSPTGSVIPVPDKLMHIFRYGFLAMAYMYNQDSRFTETNQKFIATLLGAQDGLDEAQKNIFLGNWYTMISDQTQAVIMAQQSAQARGNL